MGVKLGGGDFEGLSHGVWFSGGWVEVASKINSFGEPYQSLRNNNFICSGYLTFNFSKKVGSTTLANET